MDLPAEEGLRWIVRTYADLRAEHGDAIGEPALVQPTGEFFPDEFRLDGVSVERLLRRMIAYSPVADDIGVELAFAEPPAEHSGGGGCGSLACGTSSGARARSRPSVEELRDGYRVIVASADIAHPDLLTTSLARSVGELVLWEGSETDGTPQPAAAPYPPPSSAEIAAIACGFGVLLANGAAVWAKSCGGLRMAKATVLGVEEICVALALFAAVHRTKRSTVRASLGATQREALDLAEAWVDSNPLLVGALRDRPGLLQAGIVTMEPVRGLLGRWLHHRRVVAELRASRSAPPLSDDRRRRLEEARALVDEVLGGQ